MPARIALKRTKPEDMTLVLVPQIDANGELSVPVALVDKYAVTVGIHSAELIDPLVNNGFVTLENGILKTTVTFREGQLTLNGKRFDPPYSYSFLVNAGRRKVRVSPRLPCFSAWLYTPLHYRHVPLAVVNSANPEDIRVDINSDC
ncbi:hypothetical protein FACS1894158_08000 [Betaproteobacteria bacterium]|nr:hypothetical protein FACS1894158_08000 [Betaproteobacteria bacterium]